MPTLLLLRFDEIETAVRPADEMRNLAELTPQGATPAVVDAVLGRGRLVGVAAPGFLANDLAGRDTLATRDMTIQTWIKVDVTAQNGIAAPGVIYTRGRGGGAAEYSSGGVDVRVVNLGLRVVEVRWFWQDLAGNLKYQVGAQFVLPNGFTMITATRRWVSSTEVELRYYVGDLLANEVVSADGEIAGGTTGTTLIGNTDGDDTELEGILDELRVLDEPLTHEEVTATWRRITIEQPRGYKLLREMHDPGFPIAQDPASRAQRETRQWGNALGFAAAQGENIRENILPDRAYGAVLDRWEAITKQPPHPGDSVETRRARVVGKIRQRRGVSILGVGDATADLLATPATNLQIVAFDQTTVDAFDFLNETRWYYDPAAQWTISSSALRVQASATVLREFTSWYVARMSIGGPIHRPGEPPRPTGASIMVKVTPTTIGNDGAVGIMLCDRANNHAFTFEYRRDTGGTLRLATETILFGVRQGATNRHNPAALDPVWLVIRYEDHFDGTSVDVGWSFTSADGPFTWVTGLSPPVEEFQWAAMYARTNAAAATPTIDVKLDDARVRAPYGDRSFRFYVVRDPSFAGDPDFLGANAVLRGLKQAHTVTRAVPTLVALYDDASTTYDGPPMGGI